jgi:hypothetical protein
MVVVSTSPHKPGIVYVIVCDPAPAVTGLNIPVEVLVIPVPLQVPPEVAADRVTAASISQKGPTGLIAPLATGFTVILVVELDPHVPGIVYVIVWVPAPATEGLNVPAVAFVMPFPDHVPPGDAAVKLTAGERIQKGPAAVMVEFAMALPLATVTVPVATQPVASVTDTVYVPAHKLTAVCVVCAGTVFHE